MSAGFKRAEGTHRSRSALESLIRALYITNTPFTRIELVRLNDEYDAWQSGT